MSVRTAVLLWAQRVLAKPNPPAHVLLDVRADAPQDVISDAFQKIARMAHPDLHRTGFTQEELEAVTSAYSRVAGAYQEMRVRKTGPIQPIDKDAPRSHEQTTPPSADVTSQSMNSKALIYYRKAELALRRGDLRNGIMQIKMAIAADPGSQFLRAALSEIETETARKT